MQVLQLLSVLRIIPVWPTSHFYYSTITVVPWELRVMLPVPHRMCFCFLASSLLWIMLIQTENEIVGISNRV